MQVVPLGPKRVKLSELNDFKNNWKDVQHKVNNQQEGTNNNNKSVETLKEEKRTELEYKINTNHVVMNEFTVVVKKERNQNKLSWNNLFINQTNLLGILTLLQQGVPNE